MDDKWTLSKKNKKATDFMRKEKQKEREREDARNKSATAIIMKNTLNGTSAFVSPKRNSYSSILSSAFNLPRNPTNSPILRPVSDFRPIPREEDDEVILTQQNTWKNGRGTRNKKHTKSHKRHKKSHKSHKRHKKSRKISKRRRNTK